jgi:hypothetical protein
MFRKPASPMLAARLTDRMRTIREAPACEVHLDVSSRTVRMPRRAVYRPATLVLEQGERLDVVIRDISASGVKVAFFRQTPISEMVLIDEASLPLKRWGKVVWQRDGASGLYFIIDR